MYQNLKKQMNFLNSSLALCIILAATSVHGKTYLIKTGTGWSILNIKEIQYRNHHKAENWIKIWFGEWTFGNLVSKTKVWSWIKSVNEKEAILILLIFQFSCFKSFNFVLFLYNRNVDKSQRIFVVSEWIYASLDLNQDS